MPQGSIFIPLPFLIYIIDMPYTIDSELLLYTNDTYLVFQHKDIKTIEEHLNHNISIAIVWFVDNELSVHFGEDESKLILLPSKQIKVDRTNRYLLEGHQN